MLVIPFYCRHFSLTLSAVKYPVIALRKYRHAACHNCSRSISKGKLIKLQVSHDFGLQARNQRVDPFSKQLVGTVFSVAFVRPSNHAPGIREVFSFFRIYEKHLPWLFLGFLSSFVLLFFALFVDFSVFMSAYSLPSGAPAIGVR